MKKELMKSKTLKVYKHKKLNNANFSDFSLNDYQVFLHLVTKIGKVDKAGLYQQPESLDMEYTLTAKEFSIEFNLDVKHAYSVIKQACKKLMKTSIMLEKPDIFETWDINICSMTKYNHRSGSITIKFNNDIMPYLAQVKQRFVLYNLKEIANFGSLYTTRMYELIQEFQTTGWILKSVAQLREFFAVGDKFSRYNDFKKRTFAHAVDEINSAYNLNVQFEEIKDNSRTVTAVKFFFNPTHINKGINPYTGKERNIYIKPKPKPSSTQVNTQQPLFSDAEITTESVNDKLKNKDLERSFINPREAKTIKEVAQVAAHNFVAQTAGIIEIKNGIKKLIQKIKDVDFRHSCELTLDQMNDEAEIRAFNGDVTKYLLKN